MGDTAKYYVLIVEDSATQRELLRHTLENHGYTTTVAATAEDALRSLDSRQPDLVISDILMPGMDGFALCRAIKEHKKFHLIPIVLLTSLHDPKDVIRGLECGADSFIVKPFDARYLLSRIDYVLANAGLGSDDEGEGIEVLLDGARYTITSRRRQIVDLLLSTYEAAVRKNSELQGLQEELRSSNTELERKVRERTAALQTANEELRGEIDERKKAEAALRETIGELEAFSYSLSHDMRAPLRAMVSFAQLLQHDYGPTLDATAHDYLNRITTAAARLDTLIQDVLLYSRLLRTDIRLEPINLDSLLRQILAERPNLHRAKIEIRQPLENVMAHPAALTQCLTNLLDNAVKFSKPKVQPEISIWTTRVKDMVEVSVDDNGIGIPAGALPRIFGIFERAHGGTEYPGTGIGLSIVRKAVQRMGGEAGVESTVDEGSRFWIRLPAVEQ